MGSFCRFHVQIADSLFLSDSSVLGIGKGAGFAVAEAGQIVLVFAEVLTLGFHSKRAVFVADNVPDNFVNDHFNTKVKIIIMIQNIVILLVANTIIPFVPLPPQVFAPVPLAHFMLAQTSVYEHMNLSRIHTKQEFKKAFSGAMKTLHPDRGGSQEAFNKVKNLKKIMEKEQNYYDTLNITDADLTYNEPFQNVVDIKQTTYFVQAGIFYFIILLYGLAFTIDDDLRPARKFIIPLTFLFGAYEFYIHFYPQTPTFIDFMNNKVPIFQQKTMLKNILSVLVAAIRTKYMRRKTPEKQILDQIQKEHTNEEYENLLHKLTIIYHQKGEMKRKAANSLGSKIRDWISKGFTILVLLSLIRGFISSE